jgi:transcriptional regulator with XRE-family HTH domain
MAAKLQPIAALLKAARRKKGLTQRTLAERVGIPQSHLSKIESGAVDLQTSSLIEISRALDLELTLLPRTLLPAIQVLSTRSLTPAAPGPVPAYRLDDDGDGSGA